MLDQIDNKRSLKLKTIFRHNEARLISRDIKISPPILQHSTSIYSLASPTRTSFATGIQYNGDNKETPFELYQPLSSPPPIPRRKSPYALNSVSPSPRLLNNKTNLRHLDQRNTVANDPREQPPKKNPNKSRRHSCSAAVVHQFDGKILAKKEPVHELVHGKPSLRSKLIQNKRRSSNKVSSSTAAASIKSDNSSNISIQPEISKSTPTPRKIKTYNVSPRGRDLENQKKMKELEDLISGRRGSTLKLSLTPKELS